MPIPFLKHTQAADEIFTGLTKYIGVNNIKINNDYRGFRGYTEEEKNILMQQKPDRNRGQINTFNPDVPEPPQRESMIENIEIIILKPAEHLLSPQELVSTPLDSRRNIRGNDNYMVEPKIVGTVYGILPISIERRIYDANNDTLRNQDEITLESHVQLDDGLYALVSIICFVSDPDHYVAYYKCDEGDNWIYYDDLGINLDKMVGGTKCKDDIEAIFETWLKEYSAFVSQKLEEFENDFSEIIVDSEDIITDSLKTELLPEIIEQICNQNNSDIKDIFKKWWTKNVLVNARAQWGKIQETDYYKELKTGNSKSKSPEQKKIYNKFKKFEDSRKDLIHELIDLMSPKNAKTTRPTRPTRSTRPPRTATNKPLYMDMGHIENWQDIHMPGYDNSPRQAATLLFYKKIG
jgi:hypothetical protein